MATTFSRSDFADVTATDLASGPGRLVLDTFNRIKAQPYDGTGYGVCDPDDATTSSWPDELTAFAQLFLGPVIMFDGKCGPLGSDAAEAALPNKRPSDAAIAQQFGLLTTSVDCSTSCCTMNKLFQHAPTTCSATFLQLEGGAHDATFDEYCHDALAQQIMVWAPLLTSAAERMTCVYDWGNLTAVPEVRPETGLNGPWTCVADPGSNVATAQARQYAWNTTLNYAARLRNLTCLCPSGQAFGSGATDMCGNHGVCQLPPGCSPGISTCNLSSLTAPGLTADTAGPCACSPAYGGASGGNCTEPVSRECPDHDGLQCNGKGTCGTVGGGKVCHCSDGWDGVACEVPRCPTGHEGTLCGGNGSCYNGVCVCEEGFWGVACEKPGSGPSPSSPSTSGSTPSGSTSGSNLTSKHKHRGHMLIVVVGALLLILLLVYLFHSYSRSHAVYSGLGGVARPAAQQR